MRRPLRLIRLLILGAAVIACGLVYGGVSPWIAIPACFLPVHLLILWGQLSPYSQLLGPVVTRFRPDPDRNEIWLTIDDGPDPEETPAVLAVLDHFGARATFFLIGEKAAAHPELVREIHRRGHQVANHSSTHPQYRFWALTKAGVAAEIDDGSSALREAFREGTEKPELPPLFRSPVGMKAITLPPLLEKRGLHLVAWSARGRDGVAEPDLDRVIERLEEGTEPGAILVLHEGRGHAPELLQRLLSWLREEAGYACVIPSVDRLLAAGKPVVSEADEGARR